MHRSLKAFTGAAVAAALLFLPTLPSAAVNSSFTIDSGVLVTNIGSFALGGAPSRCVGVGTPDVTGPVVVDVSDTAGVVTTTTIVSFASGRWYNAGGTNYYMTLARTGTNADNAGTVAGTGGNAATGAVVSQKARFLMKFFAETAPGNCTQGAQVCLAQLTFATAPLAGTVGAGSFTAGVPAAGTQTSLTGTASSIAKGACAAPFNALNWAAFNNPNLLVLEF